jgi:hypothetical protein
MPEMPKEVADDLAISMLATSKFIAIDDLMKANRHEQAIRVATEGIELIERRQAEHSAPSLNPQLCSFYSLRAHQLYGLARENAAQKKELLRRAKADIDKAWDIFYRCETDCTPDMRDSLTTMRSLIQQESGGCFIATAAYGSAMAPEVATLRHFRELKLRPSQAGRLFIRAYERFSPPVAAWIAGRGWARAWVRRVILEPAIRLARHYIGHGVSEA